MIEQGAVLGGRYRLDTRIGGGGMGDVWRGEDLLLERTVALKILPPALMDEPGFVTRFRHEAQVMATIRHPGVVEIYDFGSSEVPGGVAGFLVMEYVAGESLDRVLGRLGRLSPVRAMQMMAGVAETLHAAHTAGVIHRDVKPANLLVRPDDSVVLTDFGIARSAASTQLTAKGMVLGTATYCAPEQAAGERLTPAADIYALGVVAYQCISGAPPFAGETPVEIAVKHVHEPPPPLPPEVPDAVRHVIECAMAKLPAHRWPTANALALAASTAARHPSDAFPAVGQVGNPAPAVPEDDEAIAITSYRPGHARTPRTYQRLGLVVAAAAVAATLGTAGAMVASNPAEPIGETQQVPLELGPTEKSGGEPSATPKPKRRGAVQPAQPDRRRPGRSPSATPSFPEPPTKSPEPTDPPSTPPPEPSESPSTPPSTPPPEPSEEPTRPEPSGLPTDPGGTPDPARLR